MRLRQPCYWRRREQRFNINCDPVVPVQFIRDAADQRHEPDELDSDFHHQHRIEYRVRDLRAQLRVTRPADGNERRD